MSKNRLEAFSDGVIAIIITIMVLELKVPHGAELSALLPVFPTFLSYILSFIYVGIYWNNHHHMLHLAHRSSGGVMLANLHLLFWLSLVPFATAWLGENHFAAAPTALYGVVLLCCACAYFLLQHVIYCAEGKRSELAQAIGRDRKGKVSLMLYAIAVPVAFWCPSISQVLYVAVALLWIVPDRRIEHFKPATPQG